jgi:ribosomal protein S13
MATEMKSKMQSKVAKTMRDYKEKATEKSQASKPMPMRGQRTATNAMKKKM